MLTPDYFCDKPIPAPVDRLDVLRGLGRVPQHLPQLADAHGQGGIADHHLRPDRGKERFFGDQLPGMLH